MARRKQKQVESTEGMFTLGGFTFRAPYCTCEQPVWKGQTRRDDGVWVRACCMRRTKHMFEKFGDEPVPANGSHVGTGRSTA
jgi:hypothetical protein